MMAYCHAQDQEPLKQRVYVDTTDIMVQVQVLVLADILTQT